jgi:uncharacterized membrane protein
MVIMRTVERRLDRPAVGRVSLRVPADPDAFGRFSERVAHFFGTARFLSLQTAIVIGWMVLNTLAVTRAWQWDPYPFILLNLVFSTQAAYAAHR